jgi:3-oxoacyl-[acyl-carrier-protein] synthase I
MTTSNACFLPALGIINALGSGCEQVLANLLAGSQQGMVERDGWLVEGKSIVGEVSSPLPAVPEALAEFNCRNNQLILAAFKQIEVDVQQAIEQFGKDRVAVVIGSSTSGILEGERALDYYQRTEAYPETYHYQQQEIGAPAEFLAQYLQLSNMAYTISTACSSSAKVFASARNLLSLGLCDAVVVGGADSLCQLTVNGFSALESVSDEICNPFSVNRSGINIGEGAALFLMTQSLKKKEPSPIKLSAVGESADAHHISAPHPEGEGAEVAIRAAISEANLRPEQINYINLHGTATPKNDEMESRAISRVFGDQLPCSSTKSQIGHTLGAAGANEVGFCWLLLSQYNTRHQLPRQVWDGCADPALENIGLVKNALFLPESDQRYLMSNSFAFGGSNASVIVQG